MIFKSVCFVTAFFLLSISVFAQDDAVIIVQFGDQSVSTNDTNVDMQYPEIEGATLRDANLNVGLYTYVLDSNISLTPKEFCDELKAEDNSILLCVPDMTFSIDQAITPVPAVTNDALSGQQWGLGAANIPDAWAEGIKGSGEVRVCILDSGFDITHPDLQNNIWTNPGEIADNGLDDDKNQYIDDVHGMSFIKGVQSNDVSDSNGHG